MNLMIIIAEMNRGGAEKMAASLANRISGIEGNNVSILVYDNSKSAYILSSSIKYIKLKLSSTELKLRLPVIWKVRKQIIENHIDVVFGFSAGVSEIMPIATVGLHCRIVGSERANPYNRSDSWLRRFITNLFLAHLDGVVFTTQGCRDYYSKNVQKKSIIIPNGYEKTQVYREHCTKRSNSKDIIAVGNLRKVKDYPTMIEAFSIFQKKHHDFCLHIYGEGIEEKVINSLIKAYGLEKNIFLHGSINDLTNVYSSCRFLIHSSKSESWCNAILEALSFGVPCIAADCDFGPREMIRHGCNGYLYEVGNAEKLADYMEQLAENDNLLNEMSLNARQNVQRFEFDNIFEQYYNFLKGSKDGR